VPNEMKVVFIGDASVGKTSILNRYINGTHSKNTSPTLGASFTSHTVNHNGKSVKLQIWDTSGEERYQSMAPLYYRGATVVLVVFDLADPQSFQHINRWHKQLMEYIAGSYSKLILIGNKSDLPTRKVSTEEAKNCAIALNMEYFETSAVNGTNVQEVFRSVAASRQNITSVSKQIVVTKTEKKCC